MSVTNSAILLATVATPIDSAYSMHNACTLCFLLMRTLSGQIYELVKIVEMMLVAIAPYCLAKC